MKKSDYVAEYFFSIKQDRNWKKLSGHDELVYWLKETIKKQIQDG